ncbi:reverse transcriptase family protein [Pseudolysinimonas sp.]|jgi:RNA-directed DNA polymerase|uniref:reverse transcriptase family protein n=1 Tax=Pseudolysinimonas sp. TaxID=2680009 RepID=UPI003784280A
MTISNLEVANTLRVGLPDLKRVASLIQDGTAVTAFTRRKKDGTQRTIHRPGLTATLVLKKFHEALTNSTAPPPPHVHGFVRGRSIVTNAREHLARDAVLRIDLRDFFETIDGNRIRGVFEGLGFSPSAALLAENLTTFNGTLPIGFHTSPILSNLAFASADSDLTRFAAENGLAFTRYADDLIFSGAPTSGTAVAIEAILDGHGWQVNASKTKLMKRGAKQYVTGLTVNDGSYPRIPAVVKSRMRWKLHFIERFGYEKYMIEFGGEDREDYPKRLLGMARHIAAVEPRVGGLLIRRLDLELPPSWRSEITDGEWTDWIQDFRLS